MAHEHLAAACGFRSYYGLHNRFTRYLVLCMNLSKITILNIQLYVYTVKQNVLFKLIKISNLKYPHITQYNTWLDRADAVECVCVCCVPSVSGQVLVCDVCSLQAGPTGASTLSYWGRCSDLTWSGPSRSDWTLPLIPQPYSRLFDLLPFIW